MTLAIALTLNLAIACFAAGLLLNLWRLYTAPTVPDRVLVLDTMSVNGVALVVLSATQSGDAMNFEAALLIALTGFVGTVAFCKYLLRGSIIE